ncbi:uncharacterized protein [Fopius arisanus]|uniref:Uncharacterized protein isoform X2 n=1 Tax=Fopius arisanus TaxID=64838 RepID=A0A9R1TD10_9HYME|nr:PREDICTED: uncharacterized protein LOC105268728 isoform X2 [Fopius arisanus]
MKIMTHRHYRDPDIVENSWMDVAESVNETVSECQKRWMRLKQYYSRERQRRAGEAKRGSKLLLRKPWPLYESMAFMNKHIGKRRTYPSKKLNNDETPVENGENEIEEHLECEEVETMEFEDLSVPQFQREKRLRSSTQNSLDSLEQSLRQASESISAAVNKLLQFESCDQDQALVNMILSILRACDDSRKMELREKLMNLSLEYMLPAR